MDTTSPIRVIFLITTQPGTACGVGDYTHQLANSLRQAEIEVEVVELPAWTLRTLALLVRVYRSNSDTILHWQYPTLGMGKSPAPAFLPVFFPRRRVFLTLHEFEQFNALRKIYILLFKLFTNSVVFTNEHERKVFHRFFPWRGGDGHIIPIGNNIDVAAFGGVVRRQRLIYFGQIIDGKGLEAFIDVVERLRGRGNSVPCAIIGTVPDAESAIARVVRSAAEAFDITLFEGLPADAVSRELQASSVAFLPFPDGISDRRGSALACLKHGLAVVTCHSHLTPDWLRRTTYGVTDPDGALACIEHLLAEDWPLIPEPEALAEGLAQREWSEIAAAHLRLYHG
ncbi:glycosyltransferase [Magnetospirillum fulvum]|uniref:Glycosyltransferase involved in cell wall bisynthesis n=1 Tax=Magnetospirillum fulvum TaxID=1082 RepID=A0A1H6HFE2_MAGFU|nr:glycosyltransferase [Magnetospirillum fulvum]SEH32663.1 Glycosyltransferase involved in cell wall bisynthesis [Magnetospirillum fulvum]